MTTYVVNALGLALLHSLWQGAVLAFSVWVMLGVLRKSHVRYLVSCVALTLVPVALVITVLWVYTPDVTDSLTVRVNHAVANVLHAFSTTKNTEPVMTFRLESHLLYLVVAWVVGMTLYSLKLLGGWIYVLRLRQGAHKVSSRLHRRFTLLARGVNVKRVSFLASQVVQVPMIIGVFKPVLLLPVSMLSGLTTKQLEAILLHELAHLKRYDGLVNLAQSFIETLFFYHPLVWWLSRQIRAERENCCDDVVVSVTGDALLYANALVTLESIRVANAQLVLAANGGNLLKRVQRLVTPQPNRNAAARFIVLAVVVAMLLAACSSWWGRTTTTASSESKQTICILTTVKTGKYEMPAFNTASFRVMSKVLQETNFKPRCDMDAPLELHYQMTFDARKTWWQAELVATNEAGQVVWSGSANAAIQTVGAFQYTTESTAETLLGEFLAMQSN
jgi:beta-lactamase regulating signal transducer with metallopeptidase domain